MSRVVDPKRWEKAKYLPAWLGVALMLIIVWLLTVASGLYRAFTVP